MGEPVPDHGVLPKDEEDPQNGAGDGDEDPGQEGPLEEAVLKESRHVRPPFSACARPGGLPG